MQEIELTQNKVALVDDEDYKRINQYKWCAHYDGWNWYAVRNIKESNGKQTAQYIHRLIMNTPKEMQIDHRNHNGLDNRKSNLRICTTAQNHMNRIPCKNTSSKYKGVSWYKENNKWRTQIELNNKKIHLGLYADEIEAAKVYDKKATELFGDFAYLNF